MFDAPLVRIHGAVDLFQDRFEAVLRTKSDDPVGIAEEALYLNELVRKRSEKSIRNSSPP